MEAIYICIFQRREKRLIVHGSNPNSNQESDSRLGFLEHDHCPGNLRRDGGGGQSCRHCGHLRHRSLALEFALESSRRAFALTILSPNSNSHPNIRQRRYRRWLWWTRFAAVITALQFLGAAYFLFTLMKFIYQDDPSTGCVLGLALLHRYSLSSKLCEEPLPVPEEMIHEAALFHPFAEAAYTICLL
nr:lipase class 3 family protein [Ipomoea batatas]